MSDKIEQLIRPSVRALKAYSVADAEDVIKLDAMENPFPLPDELVDDWLLILRGVELNRYPPPGAEPLKEDFKTLFGVPPELSVLFGNGSDELIQLLCLALIDSPQSQGRRPVVMAPEPGFAMYRYIAEATGLEYLGVPLKAGDFGLDQAAMLEAIERERPALVFLAYPNNPTGNLFDREAVEAVIAAAPGLVVIDEAYQPFAEDSWLPRLPGHEDVLLLRTVSKLGLAGIRLGALIGPSEWLTQLDKLRLPYNINSLTQASLRFVFRHYEVFESQARQIREQRQELWQALNRMEELSAFPSRANFILFQLKQAAAGAVFERLLQAGILLKNVSPSHPLLDRCLRVTVGTEVENRHFLDTLAKAL